jgi:hypothetical protein
VDECIHHALAVLLRNLGFFVLTAAQAGTLGATDDAQLEYATRLRCVLITHNRVDFRRAHMRALEAGRTHAGIIALPQRGLSLPRLLGRGAMMASWVAQQSHESRFYQWNDLQQLLIKTPSEDWPSVLPGFSAEEIEQALGWR